MGNLVYWVVIFLMVAIGAAVFGFGDLSGAAMRGFPLVFWVAIVLFVVSTIAALPRRA